MSNPKDPLIEDLGIQINRSLKTHDFVPSERNDWCLSCKLPLEASIHQTPAKVDLGALGMICEDYYMPPSPPKRQYKKRLTKAQIESARFAAEGPRPWVQTRFPKPPFRCYCGASFDAYEAMLAHKHDRR